MKRFAGLLVLVGCVGEAPPEPAPPVPAPAGGARETGSGEGEDDGPDMQTAVDATGYLTRIATIHCQQAFNCRATYPNDSATFDATWTTGLASCVSMLQQAWGVGTIETEIAKGRIDFDGTAAVDCLSGVAFGACDTHWTTGIQWAESCYSVMVGNVPSGGSCESLYACQSYECDATTRTCL
jgi:hypothetical protein